MKIGALDANELITYSILFIFLAAVVVLGVLTYFNLDIAFIKQQPIHFMVELLMVALVPAAAIFIFMWSRNLSAKDNGMLSGILALKFASLHILMQTSGYYTFSFA